MTSFNRDAYGTSEVWSVILARNEAPTIRAAVMGALPYAHRVLVMDGRSSDGTAEVARDAGAVVYTDEGRGKGAAIRQSITLASCDVLVFMDADGSHDPADIPRLALPVTEGNVDLCIGSRFAGGW